MKKRIVSLGVVGVDSGHIMITDPLHAGAYFIENGAGEHTAGQFSYRGAIETAKAENQGGQLKFHLGHDGAGVSFRTAFGDGIFEVFAEVVDVPGWGERVKRVWVEIITDGELKDLAADHITENN